MKQRLMSKKTSRKAGVKKSTPRAAIPKKLEQPVRPPDALADEVSAFYTITVDVGLRKSAESLRGIYHDVYGGDPRYTVSRDTEVVVVQLSGGEDTKKSHDMLGACASSLAALSPNDFSSYLRYVEERFDQLQTLRNPVNDGMRNTLRFARLASNSSEEAQARRGLGADPFTQVLIFENAALLWFTQLFPKIFFSDIDLIADTRLDEHRISAAVLDAAEMYFKTFSAIKFIRLASMPRQLLPKVQDIHRTLMDFLGIIAKAREDSNKSIVTIKTDSQGECQIEFNGSSVPPKSRPGRTLIALALLRKQAKISTREFCSLYSGYVTEEPQNTFNACMGALRELEGFKNSPELKRFKVVPDNRGGRTLSRLAFVISADLDEPALKKILDC